ncbi:radical SAM protein, partial [Thermodesulfobacteriota bacterium]
LVNGNLKQLEALCDLIIDSGLQITWGGQARLDARMDRAYLDKLGRAGCEYLGYGLESASQKIVGLMKKRFDVGQAQRLIRETSAAGIRPFVNFIIGFPGEGIHDFLKTVLFLVRNRAEIYQIGSVELSNIIPNTPLARDMDRLGIKRDDYGQWYTTDGRNNIVKRLRRLKLFYWLLPRLKVRYPSKTVPESDYYRMHGDHYSFHKHNARAIRHYRKALRLNPRDRLTRDRLAKCLGTAGGVDEAAARTEGAG